MQRDWAIFQKIGGAGLALLRYATWKEACAVVKLRANFVCINGNGDILSQA